MGDEKKEPYSTITEDEVTAWGGGVPLHHVVFYFWEVLTGEVSLDEARDNLLGFRDIDDE